MNKYYQLFTCIYVIKVSTLWIKKIQDIFPEMFNDSFIQVWKIPDANNGIFSLTTFVCTNVSYERILTQGLAPEMLEDA